MQQNVNTPEVQMINMKLNEKENLGPVALGLADAS